MHKDVGAFPFHAMDTHSLNSQAGGFLVEILGVALWRHLSVPLNSLTEINSNRRPFSLRLKNVFPSCYFLVACFFLNYAGGFHVYGHATYVCAFQYEIPFNGSRTNFRLQ